MNCIILTFWLNCWETDLIQHLVSRPPGPDSMAGYDVIMKPQIRLLTLSQIYVVSATHRAHRLISEQFVRGQSDPELKKYLWVVIRTQKDRKLQTLIEVCTDFASLSTSPNIHRPAEQVFAVEEDSESENMFAMAYRPQWTGQSGPNSTVPTSLQQMFALARKMGYEMRPIARRMDNTSQPSGSPRVPFTPGQGYRRPFRS